ncbi:hypothetical protein CC80DRAFT_502375 [Byssothecium circinans]|uniref:Uncharacterized protein n=1 Tax=Byssothecium circinans TaxID=147558 RepID=A0A6A5U664_9PLEO|nr:hypothetical protein CC80DRAFT_502375 [Byssothecium circinans]
MCHLIQEDYWCPLYHKKEEYKLRGPPCGRHSGRDAHVYNPGTEGTCYPRGEQRGPNAQVSTERSAELCPQCKQRHSLYLPRNSGSPELPARASPETMDVDKTNPARSIRKTPPELARSGSSPQGPGWPDAPSLLPPFDEIHFDDGDLYDPPEEEDRLRAQQQERQQSR